jgi:hypothetical protein
VTGSGALKRRSTDGVEDADDFNHPAKEGNETRKSVSADEPKMRALGGPGRRQELAKGRDRARSRSDLVGL